MVDTVNTRLLAQKPSGTTRAWLKRAGSSTVVAGLALPVIAALAWELVVALGWNTGRLLPPPSVILATITALWSEGDLTLHAGATLWRVVLGFGFGAAAGTIAGALTGYSSRVSHFIDPTLQALRAIPSIAWVPLFILWFGIFETPKVSLIAVGVFFPVYLGVMDAIRSVDRKIVEVGRIYRLTGPAMVRRILLPAILPAYVTSLRSGLGLGWMFVVAAEFMGASRGLGFLLIDGQQLGKPAQIVAAIIIFAVLGKLTDSLLAAATRPLLRWEDSFQAASAGAAATARREA